MKIRKVKEVIIRHAARFFKRQKRLVKSYMATDQHIKTGRRLAKMEAKKALLVGLEFLHRQVKIRPRIRLFSKFVLILIVAYIFSHEAIAYLKPKEAQIKIGGQQILVADPKETTKPDSETGLEAIVTSRRSPFEFKRPVESGYLSQGYSTYHRANDIATALGSPIHPLGSGIVEFAGKLVDGKGNVVIVDHGDGLKSLYAHMGRIDVGVGNMVNSSMTIGTVGLTGHTTGPHVHLEIYDNSLMIDPASVLPD